MVSSPTLSPLPPTPPNVPPVPKGIHCLLKVRYDWTFSGTKSLSNHRKTSGSVCHILIRPIPADSRRLPTAFEEALPLQRLRPHDDARGTRPPMAGADSGVEGGRAGAPSGGRLEEQVVSCRRNRWHSSASMASTTARPSPPPCAPSARRPRAGPPRLHLHWIHRLPPALGIGLRCRHRRLHRATSRSCAKAKAKAGKSPRDGPSGRLRLRREEVKGDAKLLSSFL